MIGPVALVGAGPGDPDLITVKGLRYLQHCDVVVYDRLVDPRLLDEAPPRAERIFAGKAAGFAVLCQRSIETILIERARVGKRVVRLKGGDPFLFGRGGEEMEALLVAGIPVEIVPGITSAIGVPAAAGIPVTHRELASTFTVVAGHEDPAKDETAVDWQWLARGTGTLVVVMGLERLPKITARLISEGRAPETRAAVISSGTWENQRTVSATLGTIAAAVQAAKLRPPALIVIGEVAAFPERLERELAGQLVSSSADQLTSRRRPMPDARWRARERSPGGRGMSRADVA